MSIQVEPGDLLWMIDSPTTALTFGFEPDEGVSFHAVGRLVRSRREPDIGRMDEEDFERNTAELAFRWRIWPMARALAADPMWETADARAALEGLRTRTPEAIIARAVYVPASPPQLERPVVETDIVVPDEAQWSQLRSLCELAFGVDGGSVHVTLDMLAFHRPRQSHDVGVATPSTEEFLRGNVYVYGRFRHLSVTTRRDAKEEEVIDESD